MERNFVAKLRKAQSGSYTIAVPKLLVEHNDLAVGESYDFSIILKPRQSSVE